MRNFLMFGKVSLLFVRQVIRTKRPFCEVLNWGWGGVISLLIVEIPWKCVTVLFRASPVSLASWLVLSRIRPRYQVDTYVYSLLLVRTRKNQGTGC